MDTFRGAVKKALATRDEKAQSFHVGDIVVIKQSAVKYYPGGPTIPGWVKELHHKVYMLSPNDFAVPSLIVLECS